MSCSLSRLVKRSLPRAGRGIVLGATVALLAAGCRTDAQLAAAREERRTAWQQPVPVPPVAPVASVVPAFPAAPPADLTAPATDTPLAAAVLPPPVIEDLSGAKSPADHEPFKLVTDTSAPVAPPPGAPAPAARTYVVQPGDTLASIARKVYGDDKAWKRLYEANRDVLPDAGRIKPGMTLRLP